MRNYVFFFHEVLSYVRCLSLINNKQASIYLECTVTGLCRLSLPVLLLCFYIRKNLDHCAHELGTIGLKGSREWTVPSWDLNGVSISLFSSDDLNQESKWGHGVVAREQPEHSEDNCHRAVAWGHLDLLFRCPPGFCQQKLGSYFIYTVCRWVGHGGFHT